MTNKRKNHRDDPDFMARMYRPLTTFQKAFGYRIIRNAPDYPHRLSMHQVRMLETVQRLLRELPIETILLEWGQWTVAPIKQRWKTTPKDKIILFFWLDGVLAGVNHNIPPGEAATARVLAGVIYILRAYVAVNLNPERPRSTRVTLERVNFEHVMDDAKQSMPAALRRAEAGWRREVKRKAVRRAPA